MWWTLLMGIALAGGKKDKNATEAPPPPPPVEAPAPPEPEEPPPPANNADFHLALSYADGRTVSGHVVRVERGVDRYADQGFTDEAKKLVVDVEAGGVESMVAWTALSQIDLKYLGKGTYTCLYDSNFDPWMYLCTVDTAAIAKGTDGKSYTVNSRYTWKFTFDDGNSTDVVLTKVYARKQDDSGKDDENYALYGDLQAELGQLPTTGLVKVVITP